MLQISIKCVHYLEIYPEMPDIFGSDSETFSNFSYVGTGIQNIISNSKVDRFTGANFNFYNSLHDISITIILSKQLISHMHGKQENLDPNRL